MRVAVRQDLYDEALKAMSAYTLQYVELWGAAVIQKPRTLNEFYDLRREFRDLILRGVNESAPAGATPEEVAAARAAAKTICARVFGSFIDPVAMVDDPGSPPGVRAMRGNKAVWEFLWVHYQRVPSLRFPCRACVNPRFLPTGAFVAAETIPSADLRPHRYQFVSGSSTDVYFGRCPKCGRAFWGLEAVKGAAE